MKSNSTSHTIVIAAVLVACSSTPSHAAFAANNLQTTTTTKPTPVFGSHHGTSKKTALGERSNTQDDSFDDGEDSVSIRTGSFGKSVSGGIVNVLSLEDVVTSLTDDWEETLAVPAAFDEFAPDIECEPTLPVKKRPISELTLGSFIDGVVVQFCSFGVFVETNYELQGGCGRALLHKNQIVRRGNKAGAGASGDSADWRLAVSLGQVLQARVTTIHYERAQVGLSLLPETKTILEMPIGREISHATVDSIRPYGIFVRVGCAVHALVHKTRIPAYQNNKKKNKSDASWSESLHVGDQVSVRIIGRDIQRSRLMASMLSQEQDEAMDQERELRPKAVSDIPVGKNVPNATVKSIRPYGIFVDVGCQVQALVHKTRVPSYNKANAGGKGWCHSVREGDCVAVRIIGRDVKRSLLMGSMLSQDEDEALDQRQLGITKALSEVQVGENMAHGWIQSIRPYGIYVDVGCQVPALVHKTRLPFYNHHKDNDWSDFVRVGEKVAVRVIAVDTQRWRLMASMLTQEEDEAIDATKAPSTWTEESTKRAEKSRWNKRVDAANKKR